MIKNISYFQFFTLVIRGLGIGSRFLLTFYLTKYISLEFQGSFTLLVTTITLLVIFFGLDFYIYSNKLLVKKPHSAISNLKNSLVFFSFGYVILFVLLKSLYVYNSIPISFWLIYLLVVFEHLGQEFFRIYVALRHLLFANVLIFVRTGLWSCFIVLGFVLNEDFRPALEYILILWLVSAIITTILGFLFYPDIKNIFNAQIDKKWIVKGLMVGSTMFLSTVCLKIIEYSDRYLITIFLDKTQLGIYAIFFQIANIINVIMFTAYISFIYPDILSSVYNKRMLDLKNHKNFLNKKVVVIVSFFMIASFFGLPHMINFIDRPELDESSSILGILILGNLFLNLSYAYHYVLIGFEKENLIFKATFIACGLNILVNLAFIPIIGIYGSALALLMSNFTLYFLKRHYEGKLIAKWKRD